MVIPRPLAKSNLSYQFRLDPMDVPADTAGSGKRIRGGSDFTQLRFQIAKRFIAASRGGYARG
jgi:hypothetical protein